jgi:hypothetical protein
MTDTRILRNAGLLKENMGATPLSQLGTLLNSIQKEYEALKAYAKKTRMEPPPGQVQSLIKGLTAAANIIKNLDADDSAKKDGIDLVNDAIESIEMELSPEGAINQLLDMMRRARFTGFDTYEFTIAEYYLSSLINGDDSGLEEDESARFDAWLNSLELPPGGHWDVVEGSEEEFAEDEVSGLRAKTVDVVYVFPKQAQGQAPLGETPIDGVSMGEGADDPKTNLAVLAQQLKPVVLGLLRSVIEGEAEEDDIRQRMFLAFKKVSDLSRALSNELAGQGRNDLYAIMDYALQTAEDSPTDKKLIGYAEQISGGILKLLRAPKQASPGVGEDNPQPKQKRVLPKRPKKNPQDDLIKGIRKELDRQIAANAEKSMRTPQK